MFTVFEITASSRSPVATRATAAEAQAAIPGKVHICEEDQDYPGFFDAMTVDGRLFVIEPKETRA